MYRDGGVRVSLPLAGLPATPAHGDSTATHAASPKLHNHRDCVLPFILNDPHLLSADPAMAHGIGSTRSLAPVRRLQAHYPLSLPGPHPAAARKP